MTQRIPSETIEYERYVDGLRRSNSKMLTVLKDIILWAERHKLTRADLITGGLAEVPVIMNARAAIAQAEGTSPGPAKAITIHVEGGLVQDVNGIPVGCEVRVLDYDLDDPGDDEAWDAEKKCVVTVYGGDGV